MKPRHPWFSLFFVLAGWVMALTASGQQQPEPDHGAATESDLYWTFPVIRDFLAPLPPQPNDDSFHPESRARNPLTWDEHPRFFAAGTIQDATSLLTQAGISLRPGRDLAFFHQTDGILYVRACREVLDLIDQFTKTLGPDPWIRTLEVEVMIVGFS